jgi:hypothetical protein
MAKPLYVLFDAQNQILLGLADSFETTLNIAHEYCVICDADFDVLDSDDGRWVVEIEGGYKYWKFKLKNDQTMFMISAAEINKPLWNKEPAYDYGPTYGDDGTDEEVLLPEWLGTASTGTYTVANLFFPGMGIVNKRDPEEEIRPGREL